VSSNQTRMRHLPVNLVGGKENGGLNNLVGSPNTDRKTFSELCLTAATSNASGGGSCIRCLPDFCYTGGHPPRLNSRRWWEIRGKGGPKRLVGGAGRIPS